MRNCCIVILLMFVMACKTKQAPVTTVPEKKESNNKSNTTQPKEKEPVKADKPEKTEKKTEKETFTLSYILPFQSDKIDLYSEEKNFENADMAIEYYNGAKIALDSLKLSGGRFNVHVFDSQNDSAAVSRVTQQSDLKKSDLIIGPVYPNELSSIAKFSKENKIYTLSPLSPASLSSYQNPYFIQANNSLEQHAETLAAYTKTKLKAKKVIIVWSNEKADSRYANAYKHALDSLDKSIAKQDVKVISGVYQYLDKNAENILFIPSADQAAVITAFKYLSTLDASYKFTVLGHPRWFDFPNLDISVMQKLKVRLTTSFHPDYYSPETIHFVMKYREVYNTEPSEFAFRGFDHTFYFGSLMMKDGKNFYKKMNAQKMNSTEFDFKQTSYGFQNQYLNIVSFEDDLLSEQK